VNRVIRMSEVQALTGLSKSSLYARVMQGTWPRPIKIGARASAWLESEVAALNAARIRGASEEEIKLLVSALVAQRAHAA
jgi:prophage regulatory protein